MEDAEVYLSAIGIPKGLPEQRLEFGPHATIHGAASQFRKTVDRFLQVAPTATWDAGLGPCTLLFIDPDAPDRAGDGSVAGKNGPWLHWLVTDAVGSVDTGKQVVEYVGPGLQMGNHRYIFILFRQSGPVAVPSTERRVRVRLR